MSISEERLAHKVRGKFQCITCGEKKPWAERMPKLEPAGTDPNELEFVGYECGGCISDQHAASYARVDEKLSKKAKPRKRTINQKDIEA